VSAEKLMQECHPAPPPWGLPASGLDPCTGDALPAWHSWVRQAQRGLEIMAEASGGFAVVNTNDFAGGVDRILTDLDNYYLLGFAPEDTRTKGYRRLEVRLKNHPELTLRYRRGYDLGEPDERKAKADPLLALASGALPETALPLRMHAAVLPGSGRDARVSIALEVTVPRATLEDADASLQDEIRYAVLAVDTKGAKVKESVGRGARMVLRPVDPTQPPPESVTYQIGEVLALPPGQYQLRASANSTKLGTGGSVYLSIDVTDFSRAPLALSHLVVGFAGGPRVPSFASPPPSRGRGPAWTGRAAGPTRPVRAAPEPAVGAPLPRVSGVPEGLPFAPTLDREFTTADDLALYFELRKRDRSRPVAISVAVVDRDDQVRRRYTRMLPVDHGGRVSFGFPLSDVGAGQFRLRVEATDGVHDAMSEIGIVVTAKQ
jgi:hypothetical protein